MRMRFIWDAEKEAANRARHDLDFATAAKVFADPMPSPIMTRCIADMARIAGRPSDWRADCCSWSA
jgi:uncharacterized DUF497 family protein